MNEYDMLHLRTQRNLAIILILGYFAAVGSLIFYWREMSAQQVAMLTGLLGVLTTVLPLTMQSFFGKHQSTSDPDLDPGVPGTTVDVTKTVTTSATTPLVPTSTETMT